MGFQVRLLRASLAGVWLALAGAPALAGESEPTCDAQARARVAELEAESGVLAPRERALVVRSAADTCAAMLRAASQAPAATPAVKADAPSAEAEADGEATAEQASGWRRLLFQKNKTRRVRNANGKWVYRD